MAIYEYGLEVISGDASRWSKNPPLEEHIEECRRWLAVYARPSKGWGKRTSYGYKHTVEAWAGRYITNGAFLEAARRMGFELRRVRDNCPNAFFKMKIEDPARRRRREQRQRDDLQIGS